ncbi:MAG: hypothetical protein GY754_34615 [bacterium]|nr:hypothetical protein [bacterium]
MLNSTFKIFLVITGILLLFPFFAGYANDGNEPPKNLWLADSPWPQSHRNPYCQASSPFPGPESVRWKTSSDFKLLTPGLITIALSGLYSDGTGVLWGGSATTIFKADPSSKKLSYIDKTIKDGFQLKPDAKISDGLSGAYTLLDNSNIFYVPQLTRICAYGDEITGDKYSDIATKRVYHIPESKLSNPDEIIVGFSMTYDGMLIFVTSHGLVGAVSRHFDEEYYFSLGDDEEISNSIALDEDGGIYIVSSKKMYRVQWTGSELTTDSAKGGWIADYEIGEEASGVRLGNGSGSTPTLMGTGSQDKFVVITDGKDLMNVVLFWRDKIPEDWEQIPGTKDRRIAAQIPVTFGDPLAENSLSEQSLCIRGYGVIVVNNQLKKNFDTDIFNLLFSGISSIAPYGVEKFEWDPVSRTLYTAWVNSTISLPNGIPSMSSQTNLVYGVGQKKWGAWTFEALDWDTGASVFSYTYGYLSLYNSAYAATEIGYDSCLYTGTFGGMVKMKP